MMRAFLVVLAIGFVLPSLSRAQTPYVPDPAVVAYESSLHARLSWLGQQEYTLRHDDIARHYRRRKILGIVLGGVSAGAALMTLYGFAFASDNGLTRDEKVVFGSVAMGFTVGALIGLGFALEASINNPHRDDLRLIRLEQRDIRRALRDAQARYSISANGFALRF